MLSSLLLVAALATTSSAATRDNTVAGKLQRRDDTVVAEEASTTCFAKSVDTEEPITSPVLTTWKPLSVLPTGLNSVCSSYPNFPPSGCVWFVGYAQKSYRFYGAGVQTTRGYFIVPTTLQLDSPDGKGGRSIIKCKPRNDGNIIW